MEHTTLEETLDKIGITAGAEERVEQRRSKEIAQKMIQKGWKSADIAEMTGLAISTVESLSAEVHSRNC